ncbi:rho GTPase-activating protein 9-like isoform X2 [Aricia agestis]|uniref:rho GTPase-activating protein 9-like isoform X2 n=1 Tax=Aricia agestis TaxID=91739 RepID=UPI001C20AD9F|nr:rho GTPase-activating protein 9-like isoform X2 [Aricia agestis]
MCELTSWIPLAVVETLRDRSAQPVVAWLTLIRATIEEYDPLVVVRPPSAASDDTEPDSEGAFDEILSQLGKEIYKLDEYRRTLAPAASEIPGSILNIFDECLDGMSRGHVENETKVIAPKRVSSENMYTENLIGEAVPLGASTPVLSAKETRTPPVPPRRPRPRSPSPSVSDDLDRLSDDSASTCWSYKECSAASPAAGERGTYALVWSHSSGYHNSDDILRRVLAASPSRLSFDTSEAGAPVAAMTPLADDGYEPVRDAITDENIYEEIEYCYTDEGCSCGSVEVESLSASEGRETPLYANLRDHDAYAIPPDVIYWKKFILGDPFYNEDEEDEWITPEECEVYSRERRPPLVIPRITQYRAPRRSPRQTQIPYSEQEVCDVPAKAWQYSPTPDRSRIDLERSFAKANYDSPSMWSAKRLGGSTENLLGNIRRPTHLQLPASSSGDSLDVEIRERKPYHQERSRSMMAPKPKARAPQPSPRLMDVRSEKKSRSEDPMVLERRYIKRTKYMEGGKKCKKNWVESYMTLTPTSIRFYKNENTYNATMRDPPSPSTPRPELVIMLHSAYVELSQHSQTRRHSRSLVLTQGNDQYLLQDESEESARNLLRKIQTIIGRLGPSYMMMEDRPSPVCSSGTDAESVGRTPPVSRHANKVKQKDEPVFGRKLEEVCPASSPRVPEFVKACIKEIESSEENMGTDGLYRASGNLSQVQKIRLEVDQNNFSVIENNTDIHVLTGSLKLFFRELKEPLIPFTLFDRVLAACSIKPREARIKEFREIIQLLPQCNRDTLKYLLEHLLKVTLYSERNRMHTANLAIVFGPTLLWAEKAENIAIDCIQQNNVVDILLNDFKEIFAEDTKVKKKA